ncbi:hypothetical protein ABZP36_018837 [Zizania latifolia]
MITQKTKKMSEFPTDFGEDADAALHGDLGEEEVVGEEALLKPSNCSSQRKMGDFSRSANRCTISSGTQPPSMAAAWSAGRLSSFLSSCASTNNASLLLIDASTLSPPPPALSARGAAGGAREELRAARVRRSAGCVCEKEDWRWQRA